MVPTFAMKLMKIARSRLAEIGAYLQFIQLSLLQIPQDEVEELVDFFKCRLLPTDIILRYPAVLDGEIESSAEICLYEEWINLDKHAGSKRISSLMTGFTSISGIEKPWRTTVACIHSTYELSRLEVSKMRFVFRELENFFKSQSQAALTRLQNLRTIILRVQDEVILPNLGHRQKRRVLTRYEHFGMNAIHTAIDIRSVIAIG